MAGGARLPERHSGLGFPVTQATRRVPTTRALRLEVLHFPQGVALVTTLTGKATGAQFFLRFIVSDTRPILAEEISENPCCSGNREGLGDLAPIRMTAGIRKNQRYPHD
jgi:hypothetical protein